MKNELPVYKNCHIINNMNIYRKIFAILLFLGMSALVFSAPNLNLKASQNEYFENAEARGLNASKNGIYPVKLTVNINVNDQTVYIKIYRAEAPEGPYSIIIDYMQPNEEYFDLYDSEPMLPGQKYYYKAVLGKQSLKKAAPENVSNVACGWGAQKK